MLPIDISKICALMLVFVGRNGNPKYWGRAYAEGLAGSNYGRDFNTVGLKRPARTSVREGQEAAEGCEQRRLGCCGWKEWV